MGQEFPDQAVELSRLGKLCGVAVGIPTFGAMTVDVIGGHAIASPRIEGAEYIMAVGNARPMEDAARIAP